MDEILRYDAFIRLIDSKYTGIDNFKTHFDLSNIYSNHRFEISKDTWQKIMDNPEILFDMYPGEFYYKKDSNGNR